MKISHITIHYRDLGRLVNLISCIFNQNFELQGDSPVFVIGDSSIICKESADKNSRVIFEVDEFGEQELVQRVEFFNYSNQEKLKLEKIESEHRLVLERKYMFSVIFNVRNY